MKALKNRLVLLLGRRKKHVSAQWRSWTALLRLFCSLCGVCKWAKIRDIFWCLKGWWKIDILFNMLKKRNEKDRDFVGKSIVFDWVRWMAKRLLNFRFFAVFSKNRCFYVVQKRIFGVQNRYPPFLSVSPPPPFYPIFRANPPPRGGGGGGYPQ